MDNAVIRRLQPSSEGRTIPEIGRSGKIFSAGSSPLQTSRATPTVEQVERQRCAAVSAIVAAVQSQRIMNTATKSEIRHISENVVGDDRTAAESFEVTFQSMSEPES